MVIIIIIIVIDICMIIIIIMIVIDIITCIVITIMIMIIIMIVMIIYIIMITRLIIIWIYENDIICLDLLRQNITNNGMIRFRILSNQCLPKPSIEIMICLSIFNMIIWFPRILIIRISLPLHQIQYLSINLFLINDLLSHIHLCQHHSFLSRLFRLHSTPNNPIILY